MLLALLLSLSNAAYYILIRRLSVSASPFLLGTAFRVICLLLFAGRLAIRGEMRSLVSKDVRRLLPWLLIVAGCNFFIETGTILGLRLTTALNATLLSRFDILFAVLLGATLFREKLRKADAWAVVLLSAGCLAVFNVRLGGIQAHLTGDLLVTAAAVFVASNAFLIRFKLRELRNDVIAFHNILFSTVPLALCSCWEQRTFSFAWTDLSLLAILGIAVFGSYVTYYAALKAMPVWRVRTMLLTVPILVLAAGVVLLRDPVSTGQMRGAALVVAGEALLAASARRGAVPDVI